MACSCFLCNGYIHVDTDYELFDNGRIRRICKDCYYKKYNETNQPRLEKNKKTF
jgi:hypothetical protein